MSLLAGYTRSLTGYWNAYSIDQLSDYGAGMQRQISYFLLQFSNPQIFPKLTFVIIIFAG